MPPPMHMVTTTSFAPRRLPSMSAWPVSRCPDMPYGWPTAIAPPLTFNRSSNAQPVAAVDHLDRERFVELPQIDVRHLQARLLQQLRHREHGTDAHLFRLAAGHRETAEHAERRQPLAGGGLRVHHDADAGAVRKLARVAGRDHAALDGRFDLRHALVRRV